MKTAKDLIQEIKALFTNVELEKPEKEEVTEVELKEEKAELVDETTDEVADETTDEEVVDETDETDVLKELEDIKNLLNDLKTDNETLKTSIDELKTANADLEKVNDELKASNEKLQEDFNKQDAADALKDSPEKTTKTKSNFGSKMQDRIARQRAELGLEKY